MKNDGPFSVRPLYLQVKDTLVQRVVAGTWKPGAAIPNEIMLSRELGISVGTVRKALDDMEGDGLITRRQGRGTFVIDQASAERAARFSNIRDADGLRIAGEVQDSEIVVSSASEAEARALRIRKGEPVFRLHRRCAHNNELFLVDDSVLPQSRFRGLPQEPEIPCSIVLLAHRFGLLLARAEEKVGVAAAEGRVAGELNVKPGTPLLTLETIVFAIDEKPIAWRRAQCHLGDGNYATVIQ